MRIWDIHPRRLCRAHLLGEHAELHAIWSVLVNGKKGYSRHPEVLRWKGKLLALYNVHERIVTEMLRRGFKHASPLDKRLARGRAVQKARVDTLKAQLENLAKKRCKCGKTGK
ncbi:MAG: pyrimidine dimer DNA glycosylase/endonuclease V [Deltaproteobacteria bacterium]|nr:pyrimidine dimer DNA glycosylase/endonuclease V [Deltaproteobacteria bacterium]